MSLFERPKTIIKEKPIEEPPKKQDKPKPSPRPKPIKDIPIEFRSIINRLSNHYWTTWFKSKIPPKEGKMLEEFKEIQELRKHVKLEALK